MMIKKEEFSLQLIDELIDLSQKWVDEDNSYGIVVNTVDDFLDKDIYVAYDKDIIVGYLLASKSIAKNGNSLIPQGSKVYYIDELYVKKIYRNRGIGKELFRFVQKNISSEYDFIELSTTNKDYKRILHFYVDELDMSFFSACLIKKVED